MMMRALLLFLSLAFALPQGGCSSPADAGPYTFIRARQAFIPAFSPADIAGMEFWYDAADATTITSASPPDVDEWADKGPKANDLAQSAVTKKPHTGGTIGTAANAIVFDGIDDYLTKTVGSKPTGTKGALFVAFKSPATWGSSRCIYSTADTAGVDNHWNLTVRVSGSDERLAVFTEEGAGNNDAVQGDTDITTSAGHIGVLISDGSTWSMRIDGAVYGLDAPLLGTNSGEWFDDVTGRDAYTVGALRRGAIVNFFNGTIGEVISYSDVDLSAPEIAQLETYLDDKWIAP